MAGMSNFLQNKLIDHIFRNMSYSVPAGLYVGIFPLATMPTAGTSGTEISYTGYGRASIPPIATAPTNWTSTGGLTTAVASAGTTGNTTNNLGGVTFGAGSGGSVAGMGGPVVIHAFGIFDAATAGNLLFYGTLTPDKTINNGDPVPIIQTSGLSITVGS